MPISYLANRGKPFKTIILSLLFISFIFLIIETPLKVKADNPPLLPGGIVYWNQNWWVDNGTVLEYTNQTIVLDGHLQINKTGSLTFRNVTLVLNCSYGLEFNITSYGTFLIYDYDENNITTSDRSEITVPSFGNGFNFWVEPNSTFKMVSSNLTKCGIPMRGGGLLIKTNGFEVKDCLIMDTNQLPYSSGHGIRIENSSGGIVKSCNFSYCVGVFAYSLADTIIVDNTFYYTGAYGIRLEPSAFNSTNVTILNNSIDHFIWGGGYPIAINSANNVIISHNTIGGPIGTAIITTENCADIDISNNKIYNFNNEGINIFGSKNVTIWNNTISKTNYGIYGGGANIEISANNISNSQVGILFGGNSRVAIVNNIIYNNLLGVNLTFNPNNVSIYHNSFINNVYQANNSGINISWDNGYPSGGNYWSDYNGFDNNGTSSQDIPPPDGIGDIPYTNIGGSGSVQDNYPLMEPLNGNLPVSNVDIIIPYRLNLSSVMINATANDDFSIVKNVTLLYRFSRDNSTWGNWITYMTDYENPWSWLFNFTDGEGFYEFYSIAVDGASKAEMALGNADTRCIYNNPPTITLISPLNNSIISMNTIISLNITDDDINVVNYSVDVGSNWTLPSPYSIETTNWTEGNHTLEVCAIDLVGDKVVETYQFTTDNTLPVIELISPDNNSIIQPGIVLDFTVSEEHLTAVNYSICNGSNLTFATPYSIDTTNWADDDYVVEIHAIDEATNKAIQPYTFTVDSICPIITLLSPDNNSIVRKGANIDLGIMDAHLDVINCSIDHGVPQTLLPNSTIPTSGWSDGVHLIEIYAMDAAGNIAYRSYQITIDGRVPMIISTTPMDNATDVALDTIITIEFSEPVNTTSVERSFILATGNTIIHGSFIWSNGNRKLSFAPDYLTNGTLYVCTIGTGAMDLVGNSLNSSFNWSFKTITTSIDNDDEIIHAEENNTWTILIPIIVVTLTVINLLGVSLNGRRE